MQSLSDELASINKEITIIFKAYDKDRNGHLDKDEITSLVNELRSSLSLHPCDENIITRIFNVIDKNHDGQIELSELTENIEKIFPILCYPDEEIEQFCRQAFADFDVDNSKYLERNEMKLFQALNCDKLGVARCTDWQIDYILSLIDDDGNFKVDIEELLFNYRIINQELLKNRPLSEKSIKKKSHVLSKRLPVITNRQDTLNPLTSIAKKYIKTKRKKDINEARKILYQETKTEELDEQNNFQFEQSREIKPINAILNPLGFKGENADNFLNVNGENVVDCGFWDSDRDITSISRMSPRARSSRNFQEAGCLKANLDVTGRNSKAPTQQHNPGTTQVLVKSYSNLEIDEELKNIYQRPDFLDCNKQESTVMDQNQDIIKFDNNNDNEANNNVVKQDYNSQIECPVTQTPGTQPEHLSIKLPGKYLNLKKTITPCIKYHTPSKSVKGNKTTNFKSDRNGLSIISPLFKKKSTRQCLEVIRDYDQILLDNDISTLSKFFEDYDTSKQSNTITDCLDFKKSQINIYNMIDKFLNGAKMYADFRIGENSDKDNLQQQIDHNLSIDENLNKDNEQYIDIKKMVQNALKTCPKNLHSQNPASVKKFEVENYKKTKTFNEIQTTRSVNCLYSASHKNDRLSEKKKNLNPLNTPSLEHNVNPYLVMPQTITKPKIGSVRQKVVSYINRTSDPIDHIENTQPLCEKSIKLTEVPAELKKNLMKKINSNKSVDFDQINKKHEVNISQPPVENELDFNFRKNTDERVYCKPLKMNNSVTGCTQQTSEKINQNKERGLQNTLPLNSVIAPRNNLAKAMNYNNKFFSSKTTRDHECGGNTAFFKDFKESPTKNKFYSPKNITSGSPLNKKR